MPRPSKPAPSLWGRWEGPPLPPRIMRKEPRFEGVEENPVFRFFCWQWTDASSWKRLKILFRFENFPRQLLRDLWLTGLKPEEALVGFWGAWLRINGRSMPLSLVATFTLSAAGFSLVPAVPAAPHLVQILIGLAGFIGLISSSFMLGALAIRPEGMLALAWLSLRLDRITMRSSTNQRPLLGDLLALAALSAGTGAAYFGGGLLGARIEAALVGGRVGWTMDPRAAILAMSLSFGGLGLLLGVLGRAFRSTFFRQSVSITGEIFELTLLLPDKPRPSGRR